MFILTFDLGTYYIKCSNGREVFSNNRGWFSLQDFCTFSNNKNNFKEECIGKYANKISKNLNYITLGRFTRISLAILKFDFQTQLSFNAA